MISNGADKRLITYKRCVTSKGECSADGLAAGRYIVSAKMSGINSQKVVEVDSLGAVVELELVLKRGKVLGRAAMENRNGIQGLQVILSPLSFHGSTYQATTEQNGEYAFENCLPGTYSILGVDSQGRYVSRKKKVPIQENRSERVDLVLVPSDACGRITVEIDKALLPGDVFLRGSLMVVDVDDSSVFMERFSMC